MSIHDQVRRVVFLKTNLMTVKLEVKRQFVDCFYHDDDYDRDFFILIIIIINMFDHLNYPGTFYFHH